MTLKIAVPNKGRLMEETLDLLRSIGLRVPHTADRRLFANVNGTKYQVLFSRADDIPEYIEMGAAHVGVTGIDLVEETGCKVKRLLDLGFGACKLIVAAPDEARLSSIDDLPANSRVATSFPNLTRRYFESKKMKVTVVPISGAAELTPYIGVADAIVDLTQTGATLKQNHLTLLDVVLESSAILIGAEVPPAAKKQEIADLVSALESVRLAHRKRYLMTNVKESVLDKVSKLLPGVSGPTVMKLATSGMVAVHSVVEEDDINALIPKLKKLGATGILVLPIERMVP